MPTTKHLVNQLGDIDSLLGRLEAEAGVEAPETITAGKPKSFSIKFGGKQPKGKEEEKEEAFTPDEAERERYYEAGKRAVRKVKEHGTDVDLDLDEMVGLEAIVQIEGRPAILVQDGHFFPPPDNWQILDTVRTQIENNLKSVGRIELTGHPEYEWCGTGFMVGENVIMTNRHVANIFCEMGFRRRWRVQPGITAQIDYVEEMGTLTTAEFMLTKVIGVHDKFDMAIFKAERTSPNGAKRPKPLQVASKPPTDKEGRLVYTVGYPAWDGRRNDPVVMRKIFSDIFNVKRLQPGEIMTYLESQKLFMHDCSTLGGNSGSCVIDMQTHQVLGLHFGGKYQQGNYAVALWDLVNDPLIKKAKVNFA